MKQQSIYQRIREHTGKDGKLPEDFSLYGLERTTDAFARDGARDAALFYHERRQKPDASAYFEAFNLLADNEYEAAFAKFSALFRESSVVRALDVLADGFETIKLGQNPYPILNELIRLLKYSDDPELIKFALLALEHVSLERLPEVKEIIMTLALADELSFFAALPAGHWPEGESKLWEIASKVRGWGRSMLIPRLNFRDRAVNQWLLTEGQFNSAKPQYSATVIISRSLLTRWLSEPEVTEETFRLWSSLLVQSLRPEPWLITYEDLEPAFQFAVASSWLKKAEAFSLDANACEILLRLDDFFRFVLMSIEGETPDFPEEDELAFKLPDPQAYEPYTETLHDLSSAIEGLFDPKIFSRLIREERGPLGLIQIQELMGLQPNPKEAMELLTEDPEENIEAFRFLLEHPRYFRKCLDYFTEVLPLNEMAKGPLAKRATVKLSSDERILIEILACLRFSPRKGRAFLLTGLQSSHQNARLSALITLQSWLHQTGVPLKTYDSELFSLIQILERYETHPLNQYYLHDICRMHIRRL